MKYVFAILALFSIVYPCVAAVNNSEAAALRQRLGDGASQVSEADLQIINKFLRAGLNRMFLTQDNGEIVQIRMELRDEKGSNNESGYAAAYISEAGKELQLAFETADSLPDQNKKALISRNLMILTAELASSKLVPLAVERVNSEDQVVRYWAVKAITQPAVVEQLKKAADAKVNEAVFKAIFACCAKENRPEIRKMMITFAGGLDNPAARQMLLEIADARIKAYNSWVAQDEIDITLLASLGQTAVTGQAEVKPQFGRKFAELYSLILQRYMKGQGKLAAADMEQLITIIAETDQNCVVKMFEIKTGMLPAIRMKQKTSLEREYETLFGNRMMAGELAAKFHFDYGKDSSGNAMTAPPEIGPMPEAVAGK